MAEFNFLKRYCGLLENTEVPPRFAIWTGIATILAALERRVWVNQGIFSIYPNFYIVLVAASGQKKSTAIMQSAKLLRGLSPGPNVISQKITPEALIAAIKTEQTLSEKRISVPRAGGIVIADELTTFLDRNTLDKGLGPILTSLYDCVPFEYRTVGRGVETITDGYLSILGGTTLDLLKAALPRDAVGGGFTSRTLFIYEDRKPPPVAWIEYDETKSELVDELTNYLQRLMLLCGPIDITKEAKEFYIADYNDRRYHSEFAHNPLLTSYENRRHTHLFKVAIALMMSESPSMTLEVHHIQGAKIILEEECERHLIKVLELASATDSGLNTTLVDQFILSRVKVTRSDLVRHFSHKLDVHELNKVLDTLVAANQIRVDTEGRKIVYIHERASQ